MSDETPSDLDPRFDPAFQRGFDASVHSSPATRPAAVPSRQSQARDAAPATRAPAAPAPATRAPAAPAPATTSEQPLPSVEPRGEGFPPPFAPESPTGRNPFLIVLGIVAVVLVAIGVWLFTQAEAGFNSHAVRPQGDYMALGATLQAAPFISLLGVATAIGVVFVFAVRWNRRG